MRGPAQYLQCRRPGRWRHGHMARRATVGRRLQLVPARGQHLLPAPDPRRNRPGRGRLLARRRVDVEHRPVLQGADGRRQVTPDHGVSDRRRRGVERRRADQCRRFPVRLVSQQWSRGPVRRLQPRRHHRVGAGREDHGDGQGEDGHDHARAGGRTPNGSPISGPPSTPPTSRRPRASTGERPEAWVVPPSTSWRPRPPGQGVRTSSRTSFRTNGRSWCPIRSGTAGSDRRSTASSSRSYPSPATGPSPRRTESSTGVRRSHSTGTCFSSSHRPAACVPPSGSAEGLWTTLS